MKLSKRKVIKYCDETINELQNGSNLFLCCKLKEFIKKKTFWGKLFGFNEDLSKHIPGFTYENAKKHCNAKIRHTSYNTYDNSWWSVLDSYNNLYNSKDRIKFLKWIKSHYTTPEK